MKRRLRGLLALTLALCMGLTMTVSAASATSYSLFDNGDGSWGLYEYDVNGGKVGNKITIVKKGDEIHAKRSGGGENFIRVDTDSSTITDTNILDGDTSKGASTVVVKKEDDSNTTKYGYNKDISPDGDIFVVDKDSVVQVGVTADYYLVGFPKTEPLVTLYLTPYTPAPPPPPISYKIKYVMEEGSETSAYSDSFTAGTAGSAGVIASAEELGFIKEGFKANPQWLLPDGTTVDTGAAIKDVFSRLQANSVSAGYRQQEIVLTAQWEDLQYTVKYDANGGKGFMEDQIFLVDQKGTLTKNAFTCKGHEFRGWNTKADGSGKRYKDKAAVLNLAKGGETITLYAQWKELPEEPINPPEDKGPAAPPADKGNTGGGYDYDNSASTGDDSDVMLWTFLAAVAMLTAAGVLAGSYRKES